MTTTDKLTDRDWLISLLTIEQEQMLTDYEVHPDAWKGDPERKDCIAALADGILDGLAHRRASQAAPADDSYKQRIKALAGLIKHRNNDGKGERSLFDHVKELAELEKAAPAPSDGLREAVGNFLLEKGGVFRCGEGAELNDAYEAAVNLWELRK